MLIGDDNDLIFTRLDLEPALRSMLMLPAATAPPNLRPPPSRVRTRGGDFHDANAAQRAALLLHDGALQRFEHSLL